MSEHQFELQEKKLIEEFIKKANKSVKNISFKYDLYEKNYIGQKYEIPRGNAMAEKWSDRMFSDNFYIKDMISYEIKKKDKKIGNVRFIRYVCSKLIGEDIVTINIVDGKSDFIHDFEFYPGMGIRVHTNMPASKYFDYSEFKTKYTDKEIIKDELFLYKNKIGRGKEDIIQFFDDKMKNLIKKIK